MTPIVNLKPRPNRFLFRPIRDTMALLLFSLVLSFGVINVAEACTGNTCSQCITSGGDCAWCADANFTLVAGERCGLPSTLAAKGCTDMQNPSTEEDLSKRKDEETKDGVNDDGTDSIQLQPQRMHIRVRPRGKGKDFDVTFRPANNFPVDLYFLFDLSATMSQYIKDLASLANDIAEEIGKISTNYRLGFGTFQDKVILPFTNTHKSKLLNPCTVKTPCAPPFDYRHELQLTKNLKEFKHIVDTSNTTGNIDTPEGGLDAMMQVITCKAIGWRENSRQIIIFASDARMHFAGDGKLAGLIQPNDGECHMDDNRTNSMANKQDYPSLGQISYALDEAKKHVIFAVPEGLYNEYVEVNKRVIRSSVNKLMADKNNNILTIVRDKYRELAKGVTLGHTTSSEKIKVTITPTCTDRNGTGCTNLVIGEKVSPFRVNVKVDSCPADPKDRLQTVIISPTDFLKDKLNITVEIVCDCDCQNVEDLVPAEECSHGNGSLVCGICSCNSGRSGSNCECSRQDLGSSTIDNSCYKPGSNGTATPECSGFGECVCGVCQCQQLRSGQYCQCNDAACPAYNGLTCSGNGECRCEQCFCAQNYSGIACECPSSTDNCLAPQTEEGGEEVSKVCSGHGTCQCGACVCQDGYIGRHCQTCYSCGNSVCDVDNYHECALCHVILERQCPDDCPLVVVVDELQIQGDLTEPCQDWRSEECNIPFAVQNPGVNTTIFVQRTQVCSEGPNIWIIIGGVVGGVLLVGLILLFLVKLLTSLFDRLEYQHFVKELQSPKWAKFNNPIYKEATKTYYNPALNKN